MEFRALPAIRKTKLHAIIGAKLEILDRDRARSDSRLEKLVKTGGRGVIGAWRAHHVQRVEIPLGLEGPQRVDLTRNADDRQPAPSLA